MAHYSWFTYENSDFPVRYVCYQRVLPFFRRFEWCNHEPLKLEPLQASQSLSERLPSLQSSSSRPSKDKDTQKDQKQLLGRFGWHQKHVSGWYLPAIQNLWFDFCDCYLGKHEYSKAVQQYQILGFEITNFGAAWPKKTRALGNNYHFTISNDSTEGQTVKLETFL